MKVALRGYERAEVDAFLDRCAASLGAAASSFPELSGIRAAGASVTVEDIELVVFTRVFRGYACPEVDGLLDRIAVMLRQRQSPPS